ncbi:MAG: response regulator [Chloroflexi bacterium]|nr:response regulator [Chloroflexota bacterium]
MNNKDGKILVVEDIPSILDLLEITLKFRGYQVMTARNGQEALEKIEEERPALIISDILMPTMDGFSFVQKLRTNPKTLDIPVIFLSATYVTPEDKAFALSLGASNFIEKPIDTEEFLLTIAELLTQGTPTTPRPLDQESFYMGYRARLENKLRYKRTQIARAERLVQTVSEDQRPAYEALLQQALLDRREIEKELKEVLRIIEEFQK